MVIVCVVGLDIYGLGWKLMVFSTRLLSIFCQVLHFNSPNDFLCEATAGKDMATSIPLNICNATERSEKLDLLLGTQVCG